MQNVVMEHKNECPDAEQHRTRSCNSEMNVVNTGTSGESHPMNSASESEMPFVTVSIYLWNQQHSY